MAAVKAWLLGVTLTALAAGLARQLAPQGREQAAVRLVGGLLLVLALLRPIAALRWEDLPALEAGSFSAQTEEQARAYRQEQTDALSAIIAERLEAYIWDKGCELGLELAVTVTCAETESGVPLPDAVTIAGPYSAALSAWLTEEVGIPAEKQIWLEASE